LILATGNVYRRKDGELVPISGKARAIYAGALGIWLVAVVVKQSVAPDSWDANDPNISEAVAATPTPGSKAKAEQRPVQNATLPRGRGAVPDCSNLVLKEELLRVVKRAHDRTGIPMDRTFSMAFESMQEIDTPRARQIRRAMEAMDEWKGNSLRICASTNPQLEGFATVAVGGNTEGWGGVIMDTPFPPLPFGD